MSRYIQTTESVLFYDPALARSSLPIPRGIHQVTGAILHILANR
ncbi:hypothetical protein [Photobacterium nomapromontoriensis]